MSSKPVNFLEVLARASPRRVQAGLLMQSRCWLRGARPRTSKVSTDNRIRSTKPPGALSYLLHAVTSAASSRCGTTKRKRNRTVMSRFSSSAYRKSEVAWSFPHRAPLSGAWRFLPKTGHPSIPKPAPSPRPRGQVESFPRFRRFFPLRELRGQGVPRAIYLFSHPRQRRGRAEPGP